LPFLEAFRGLNTDFFQIEFRKEKTGKLSELHIALKESGENIPRVSIVSQPVYPYYRIVHGGHPVDIRIQDICDDLMKTLLLNSGLLIEWLRNKTIPAVSVKKA
jgi:hypothetical protein